MSTAAKPRANETKRDNVSGLLSRALDAGEGLLRLTPTWVPRSFLASRQADQAAPRRLVRLRRPPRRHRRALVRQHDRGGQRRPRAGRRAELRAVRRRSSFMLRDAVAEAGARLIGKAMFDKYKRWPVYSKFFDNMGPIPHHMHQSFEARQARRPGRQARELLLPAAATTTSTTTSPTRSWAWSRARPRTSVRKCLENWNKGDNGILDLSQAYRLKRGTGWLIPPGVLHAPGSLCTYEPQWGSDVFGMFQSLVEGREVPWSLLVKDMPKEKHQGPRLHRRPARLGEERRHALQGAQLPGADRRPRAQRQRLHRSLDRLRHGRRRAALQRQGTDARARREVHAQDPGASGWITVQGKGRIGKLDIADAGDDPLRRSRPRTKSSSRTKRPRAGVEIENTGSEPLVGLRYFGPDVHANLPKIGDYEVTRHDDTTSIATHRSESHDPSIQACQQLPETSQRRLAGRRRQRAEGSEPPIDLDTMLDLTAAAEVDGAEVRRRRSVSVRPARRASTRPTTSSKSWPTRSARADLVDRLGRRAGLAADRRRLGDGRRRGPQAVPRRRSARAAASPSSFAQLGVRPYGVVRIDSACGAGRLGRRTRRPTRKRIADTFREACDIADDYGERLAAEGEICWGGMHSWQRHGRAARSGRTARKRSASRPTWPTRCSSCWATTRRKIASCPPTSTGTTRPRSTPAYKQLTDALRPWTIDFHVAQNDGDRLRLRLARQDRPPLPAQRPDGKLDIVKYAGYWLRDDSGKPTKRFSHICWDGCMFPNDTLMKPANVERHPGAMIAVRDAHGWKE